MYAGPSTVEIEGCLDAHRRAPDSLPAPYLVLRRLLGSVAAMAAVLTLAFLLVAAMSGPRVAMSANTDISTARLDRAEADLHLNEPLVRRYGLWWRDVISGKLGTSAISGESVWSVVGRASWPTLQLIAVGIGLGGSLALLAGLVTSLRPRSIQDRAAIPLMLATSVPLFLIAIALRLIAESLDIAPGHFAVAALCLAAVTGAAWSAAYRDNVRTILSADYVTLAYARGLPRRHVLWRHVHCMALVHFVERIILQLGTLVAAAIVVEAVFARPGLGTTLQNALANGDLPVVLGWFVIVVPIIVFAGFAAEAAVKFGALGVRRG